MNSGSCSQISPSCNCPISYRSDDKMPGLLTGHESGSGEKVPKVHEKKPWYWSYIFLRTRLRQAKLKFTFSRSVLFVFVVVAYKVPIMIDLKKIMTLFVTKFSFKSAIPARWQIIIADMKKDGWNKNKTCTVACGIPHATTPTTQVSYNEPIAFYSRWGEHDWGIYQLKASSLAVVLHMEALYSYRFKVAKK